MYSSNTDADQHSFIWMVKNSIVPRPIAWVSTTDSQGIHNLAPFSYFSPLTMEPPTIMFSIEKETDTLNNIARQREFTINMALAGQEELIARTAATLPSHIDEAAQVGLTWAPGIRVGTPRLINSGPNLECRLIKIDSFTTAKLVFGEVVGVCVDDGLLRPDGRIDQDLYHPVGRMGGATFTHINNWHRHPIPKPPTSLQTANS